MDEDGFTTSIFPELPPPRERWEVTFTRVTGDGEPVVPCAPGVGGVIAMYCAGKSEAIAVVEGPEDGAEAEARKLCAGMPWVLRATAAVAKAGSSVFRVPVAE